MISFIDMSNTFSLSVINIKKNIKKIQNVSMKSQAVNKKKATVISRFI